MAFWAKWHERVAVPGSSRPSISHDDDEAALARRQMVNEQLKARDIRDPHVLEAMAKVPRERFVSADLRGRAYHDRPLSIGDRQTISQPYIVALMTQLAKPTIQSRALEVGVGSGYQTAILAEICHHVYGIEINPRLAKTASSRLASLGYTNVSVCCGDGFSGWPEYAPFDVILVAAAPERVPPCLVEQLAEGGRLVIPVGKASQELMLLEKLIDGRVCQTAITPVQFVPMTRHATDVDR